MNDTVTIPSSLTSIRTTEPMSPNMRAIIWHIASALDAKRVKSTENAVWLSISSSELRGPGARDDNQHLVGLLDRLLGMKLKGSFKQDEWGAVLLAQWHLEEGGSLVRLLVPPAAIAVICSPATFTKIEARAAHSLSGHARTLYALLSDKKHLKQQHWTFELDELRDLLNCADKKSYQDFGQFNKWVLKPAIESINDFGSVELAMTQKRYARSVKWIRFDWKWRDPFDAEATALENERHSKTRRKNQTDCEAPPLIEDEQTDTTEKQEISVEERWWSKLSNDERESLTNKYREASIEMLGGKTQTFQRKAGDIIRAAFKDRDNSA